MSKDGKRLRILLAAERLLADPRFHEVTLGEVARVAAVGKGTIYQYFEDTEYLFCNGAAAPGPSGAARPPSPEARAPA